MGSVIYDFLADSLFFHEESIQNNFVKESESRIQQELELYRNHCISNYKNLTLEIKKRESFLKVFSSSNKTPINLLKQTALYVDQFIIQDPLFSFTEIKNETAITTANYLGYKNTKLIDRVSIAESSKFLKEITPMIVGNYVKIFPASYHFEAPKEIPIYIPTNYYNDILPEEILNFFRENVIVHSMKKIENDGWQVLENQLIPCRSILIDFLGNENKEKMIFHLFQTEVLSIDEEKRIVKVQKTLPETPPDENYFQAWVTQSINSTSKAFFDNTFKECLLASNLNSTLLCENDFTRRLISENYNVKETIQTETANHMLNFELPFLDRIDINKLMYIREMDADVFTNFRLELEKNFRELRTLNDPKLIKQKTENILHELNEVQLNKIKQKISHINNQFAVNSLIGIGGLVGTVSIGGFSLIATALAIAKGYKDYNEYKEKVRENPSYLLWKIKK